MLRDGHFSCSSCGSLEDYVHLSITDLEYARSYAIILPPFKLEVHIKCTLCGTLDVNRVYISRKEENWGFEEPYT